MPVANFEIRAALDSYLEAHGDERKSLEPLIAVIDGAGSPASRTNYSPGHVTCGAIAVGPFGNVLQIRHRTLDRWLLPGGHVEETDRSLIDAATRELVEETGVESSSLRPILYRPVDIDVHEIPWSPHKGEPEHLHFDLRFLFALGEDPTVRLQEEEVSAYRWVLPTELPMRLGGRVRSALLTGA